MTPRTIQWTRNDAAMTLPPERGRILQVTSADREAFWVDPAWDGGWNVGGDRLGRLAGTVDSQRVDRGSGRAAVRGTSTTERRTT